MASMKPLDAFQRATQCMHRDFPKGLQTAAEDAAVDAVLRALPSMAKKDLIAITTAILASGKKALVVRTIDALRPAFQQHAPFQPGLFSWDGTPCKEAGAFLAAMYETPTFSSLAMLTQILRMLASSSKSNTSWTSAIHALCLHISDQPTTPPLAHEHAVILAKVRMGPMRLFGFPTAHNALRTLDVMLERVLTPEAWIEAYEATEWHEKSLAAIYTVAGVGVAVQALRSNPDDFGHDDHAKNQSFHGATNSLLQAFPHRDTMLYQTPAQQAPLIAAHQANTLHGSPR